MTHPSQEDALIEDITNKDIAQAAFLEAHPEAAIKGRGRSHH